MEPYGGALVDLIAGADRIDALKEQSRDWPSWQLSPRQLGDLELLLTGGFSPLTGFMGRRDYDSVLERMRLADGAFWPLPITLDVSDELGRQLRPDDRLVLRDLFGVAVAVLRVTDAWQPGLTREAEHVYGTDRPDHPGVAMLREGTHSWYVGGSLEGLERPEHYDFAELRLTPAEVRRRITALGWSRTVAFETRHPMHRAQQELTLRVIRDLDAGLLIQPTVGQTKTGDIEHFARVRCIQAVVGQYPPERVLLALLPFSSRLAGPREAALLAIAHRNHGCSHFLVGRDHAGAGRDAQGRPFYSPDAARALLEEHAAELGITPVASRQMVYLPEQRHYAPRDEVPAGAQALSLSPAELAEKLERGETIPAHFSHPEVIAELRKARPPRAQQGFTVFCSGLPSAGKSTVAQVLMIRLLEIGGRPVTLLDGDIVRTHLSSELGFSRHDRDLNITRIGFVASEITKNGGVAICAPIAPYDRVRKQVRSMIAPKGGFVLVHVATPLATCEQRDRKGLYAKARAGLIDEFTGISDPYEPPQDAEVVVDTASQSPAACAETILTYLRQRGYLPAGAASAETGAG
jgi:sulfate adenylyltransferase